MRSHNYEITFRDFARLVLPTLGVLATFAAALHLAYWLNWLPARPITFNADETVLRHQARASMAKHPAQFVLVGDSTCHTSVDAAQLSRLLPQQQRAINLALVINIELSVYARVAADFAEANPNQVRWVVLLLTPARLAHRGETGLWQRILDETRSGHKSDRSVSLEEIFGARLFRERFAGALLPEPFTGVGGRPFGFTTELDRYMTAHDGSVVDFGEMQILPARAPAAFPVAADFAEACREFRACLPPGVKLAVGLTPVPALASGPETPAAYRACLSQLDQFLQPDVLLTNLPVTQPTPGFSPTAHMNSVGQRQFTTALAKELSRLP